MKLLLATLLLASFLRLWDISHLPNGLHWDEQDTGYQAYSLLKTGKDYFGNPMPIFPHSMADWRTPVFVYSTLPFVKLFGLTPLAVRLPSAISGILAVLLIYYLGNQLFKKPAGILAALVLSLSPWHVLYGRQSVECNIMLLYLLLGLVTFYKSLKNSRWLPISAIAFALTIASYSPAKLFVPLLVTFLIILHKPKLNFASTAIFLLISLPLLWISTFGPVGARFHDLSLFTDPTTASIVNQKRLDSAVSSGRPRAVGLKPSLMDKMVYNKLSLPITNFISNYLNTFSTQYLFTQGDQELRHSPSRGSIGQLHLVEVIPLLIGLYIVIRHRYWLLAFWFLIGPIPSALTRDGGPHAARTFLMLPAFALTVALGVSHLKKSLFWGYCLVFFISCFFIYHYFFTIYRFESAKPFHWGYDQAVNLAVANSPKYDHVYIDLREDSALMSYLFYTHYDPAKFQSLQPLHTIEPFPESTAVVFSNIYLLEPGVRNWTNPKPPGSNLVISAASQPLIDTQIKHLQEINYPDSSPAFYVFER